MVNLWISCFYRVSTPFLRCRLHVTAFEAQEALDGGCWEMLSLEEALAFLDQMIELPSVGNIISILQKNIEKKDLKNAKRLHLLIHICGLDTVYRVRNYLVHMFVECGSMSDAYQAFRKLVQRNEYSWTSLIQGSIEGGHCAFLFKEMQQDCLHPSTYMLQALLKVCARSKSVKEGQEIHFQIAKEGFEEDLFVGNALVDMYAKCGSLVEAQEVFDNLPVRDVVLWTALIAGYAEHDLYQEALNCLEQMRLEGLSPTAVTYLCSLKGFGSVGAIDRGHKAYADIVKQGFEKDLFVGSTLVDMYAKCGFLAEAQGVFNKLPFRNAISWNALITVYTDNMFGQEVLNLLEQMQLEGVSPDAVTFVCSLKGCGIVGANERGRYIHAGIAKHGLEGVPSVGNTLVDMYAKCGLLAEAQNVFDKLLVQNVVSWTALITGYAEHGFDEEALICFEQMQLRDICPDAIAFVGSLKAVSSQKDTSKGQELHFEIIKEGFETDLFIGNSLVDMYAQSGLLSEAWEVLTELPVRDVVSWNALISGHVERGLGEESLTCLKRMLEDCVSPDAVTFMCSLKACTCIGDIGRGQDIHAEIAKEGYENDIYVGNTMVDMYAKFGSLVEACELFDELPVRDVASWTARISGYTEHGLGAEALNSLEQMQLKGVSPNAATFVCCLKACSRVRAIGKGRILHAEIVRKGLESYPSVGSSLVDMYTKCSLLVEARDVFDGLSTRDDVSYNALLWGYAEHGYSVEALNCVEQMNFEGVVPDGVTFGSILKACGTVGAIVLGQEMHCEIVKRAFERDVFVGGNLVDLYAKCGLRAEARSTSNKLPIQDTVPWNTLIAGYAECGDGEEALNCLVQMLLEGMSPNEITYVCTLKACGSIGALDTGREIHTNIVKEEFEKDSFIGNTLVDMYAKCGSLTEAQEVFDELPHRDVVSWNVLVAGYASQGESDLVFDLFERMREDDIEPNATTFLSILIVCNHVGLMDKGQQYFEVVSKEHACILTIDHHNCIVDLLGRAGQLENVKGMLEQMPFQPNLVTWSSVMGSCRKFRNVDLGRWAFDCAVCLDQKETSTFISMSNIYADDQNE